MGMISDLKNRMALERGLQFGREFYELDLAEFIPPIRSLLLGEIERLQRPIPQVVFFMLVPAFLDHLSGLKRLELYDGAMSLRLQGAMPEVVYENFTYFYGQATQQ
jgi:hypothetical protein